MRGGDMNDEGERERGGRKRIGKVEKKEREIRCESGKEKRWRKRMVERERVVEKGNGGERE